MGLMEKALQYKNEMNRQGKETLIDRIQGPADTEVVDEEILRVDEDLVEVFPEEGPALSAESFRAGKPGREVQDDELFQLPEEGASAPLKDVGKEEAVRAGGDAHPFGELGEEPGVGPSSEFDTMEDPLGPMDEPGDISGAVKKQGTLPERALEGQRDDEKGNEDLSTRIAERIEETARQNRRPHDIMVLYELGKEIVRAETRKDLYDVILFSIMGQIGVSSSLIIVPADEEERRWVIADSRGITLSEEHVSFDASKGIMREVLGKRDVLDLERYKDVSEHRDEYYEFVSIDARLLVPVNLDGKVYGIIALGEKINIGDYTDAEKDFILSICEISAISLWRINTVESLTKAVKTNEEERSFVSRLDQIWRRLAASPDPATLGIIIQEEVALLGIRSYGIFLKDDRKDAFVPVIAEAEDTFSFLDSDFMIPRQAAFLRLLEQGSGMVKVENHASLDSVRSLFDDSRVKKMNRLWMCPFSAGSRLLGFFAFFRIDEAAGLKGRDVQLEALSRLVLPYVYTVRNLDEREYIYFDAVEPAIKKIGAAFSNARDLNIPFTLVLFSIKNLKRYHALYGSGETDVLLDRCEKIITSRLSDSDFAVRMDRSKILLVLPGKNKKFAVPLANAVRNEIAQSVKNREMQLMLVYLTAEYPEDGEDLYTLLDSIE